VRHSQREAENLAKTRQRRSPCLVVALRGIAIGEKRGESRGIRLIAVNMKNQGLDTDIIIKTTGLSKEEIELL